MLYVYCASTKIANIKLGGQPMTHKFEIEILPVLDTNYAIFIKCCTTGKVAMVDAPDDAKIIDFFWRSGAGAPVWCW